MIDSDIKEIHQLLIEVLVDFNKKSIKINTDKNQLKYKLRDSIFYRLSSSVYHYNLICKTKKEALERMAMSGNFSNKILLIQSSEEVFYIYDDFIFNLLSLFDYIGNLIGFIYLGEHNSAIQWKGVIANQSKITNSNLVSYILKINKELIDKLYGYRSDIIHFKKDGSDSMHTIRGSDNDELSHEFRINVPVGLTKRLRHLKAHKDADIIDVSYSLLSTLIENVKIIMNLISVDIIPKNKANMTRLIAEYEKEAKFS